jgi:hypothetical protein
VLEKLRAERRNRILSAIRVRFDCLTSIFVTASTDEAIALIQVALTKAETIFS